MVKFCRNIRGALGEATQFDRGQTEEPDCIIYRPRKCVFHEFPTYKRCVLYQNESNAAKLLIPTVTEPQLAQSVHRARWVKRDIRRH